MNGSIGQQALTKEIVWPVAKANTRGQRDVTCNFMQGLSQGLDFEQNDAAVKGVSWRMHESHSNKKCNKDNHASSAF